VSGGRLSHACVQLVSLHRTNLIGAFPLQPLYFDAHASKFQSTSVVILPCLLHRRKFCKPRNPFLLRHLLGDKVRGGCEDNTG
jgi:hypothetical protein